MKTMFRLTWLMLKAYGLGMGGDTKRADMRTPKPGPDGLLQAVRPRRRFPVALLFPLLFAPIAVSLAAFANILYDALEGFGLQAAILGTATGAGAVVVFFFGVFYVLSIFYFSSDVEKLLPLPLRAFEILGAKFLVTTVYEYIGALLITGPLYITYGIRSGAGPAFYVIATLVYLLLPVIPLAIASILVMAVMRFTPFARNRDVFNIVVSLLILVLALGFNVGMQKLIGISDPNLVTKLLGQDGGSIARITSSMFPGTGFAASALATAGSLESLGNLLLFVLFSAAAFGVFLLAGNFLYFAGVLGAGSATSRSRRLTATQLARGTASADAAVTYVRKELRILVRTPIFLLNNVIMNFLFPFFLLIPFAAGGSGDADLEGLLTLVRSGVFAKGTEMAAPALAVCFGLMVFASSTNGIAASALSRDGSSAWFMKTIPMSYSRQIGCKVATGVLLSLCATLISTIFVCVLIAPPVWFVALLLVAALIGAVMPNVVGILFDLRWPKLNWDNEQKAVKQNLNVLYEMFIAFAVIAAAVVPVFAWKLPFAAGVAILFGVPLLVTAAAVWLLRSRGAAWVVALDM